MFLEVNITIYDPLDRKLDLTKELAPFFVSGGTEWNNCASKGIYVSCGNYFVMKKMKALGLKYLSEPVVSKDDESSYSLMVFSSLAMSQGHVFSEEDMNDLKELFGQGAPQVTVFPELPSGPQFDGFREQFNAVRNALELFKNRLN